MNQTDDLDHHWASRPAFVIRQVSLDKGRGSIDSITIAAVEVTLTRDRIGTGEIFASQRSSAFLRRVSAPSPTMPLPTMRAVIISPSHPVPTLVTPLPPPILPPSPFPAHLSIRVSHAALNPADWKLAKALAPSVKGPLVLGVDCAGIVVSKSPTARIPIGTRIVAFTRMGEQRKGGCFAEYCLAEEAACAVVPDNMSMEEAASLPVGFLTSAIAFHYPNGSLGIPIPKEPANEKGKSVLIWGASSSTGTFAVQLARHAGLRVIAVCSPKNFDLVRKLGAEWTLD